MEIFVAVVETGKFTSAANMLSLSKSAVSHAVRDLEEYLNFQCIRRDVQGLQLTASGHDYYEQCCRILSDIKEMETSFRYDDQQLKGNIRITAPIAFGGSQLAAVIAEFSKFHPDIRISLDLNNSIVNLIEAGMDVAIRISERPRDSFMVRNLKIIEMCMCASPIFVAEHPKIENMQDLLKVDCLMYSGTKEWGMRQGVREHKIVPVGAIVSDSGYALREFALAGCGVTYLPKFLVMRELANGSLVQVLPEYEGKKLQAHAVFAPNRHRSQRVRGFIDFLENAFST
ncbi:MAG: hypothetical protein COA43_07680 [Robiginitomaculum sp.]|nr:MAG: hypothetical protein COA43_07680 [Robiginitomaculum sp.]